MRNVRIPGLVGSRMRALQNAIFAGAALLGTVGTESFAQGTDLNVLASIKPVHSLVSGVMRGIGEPRLIVRGAASPHSYAIRPSDADAIEESDVIFLIDERFEASLYHSVETLARDATIVELSRTENLVLKPLRSGGGFDEHGEHATDGHHDHNGHTHNHSTDAHLVDLHVWTDPHNASVMAGEIAQVLAEADSGNAAAYLKNAEMMAGELMELVTEADSMLSQAGDKPFIVFHDGFRYFEDRFDLMAVGSIVVNPGQPPGVRRIRELQHKVHELNVVCVFREPQFNKRMAETVVEGSEVRLGTVDPIGVDIEDGVNLYFELIRNMASDVRDCLVE